MKTIRDLSGNQYGRLTVLYHTETTKTPNGTSVVLWLCKCSCGNLVKVRGSNLRTNSARSCGCLRSEVEKVAGITHGLTGLPEYHSWRGMRERCTNPNNSHYKYYGGRGITFDKRWNNFATFYKDMGPRPAGKTLDRKNNDGNYEPANCRWATDTEQRNNKRSRKKIDVNSACNIKSIQRPVHKSGRTDCGA